MLHLWLKKNLVKHQKVSKYYENEWSFRPNFDPFWPTFCASNFFSWLLPLLDFINCCNLSLYAISRKTNQPILRRWQKKTSFGLDFGPVGQSLGQTFFLLILPLLDVRNCRKLSLYAISKKTNEPNLRKWKKKQCWTWFWHIWPKFGPSIVLFCFFKNLASSVTRFYGQL